MEKVYRRTSTRSVGHIKTWMVWERDIFMREMKEAIKKVGTLIVLLVLAIIFIQNYLLKQNVHYKDSNYCFVVVYADSEAGQNVYSGTMSCQDYERWVSGDKGTVFIYTDNKARHGYRISIPSITRISNYGDTPYAYD